MTLPAHAPPKTSTAAGPGRDSSNAVAGSNPTTGVLFEDLPPGPHPGPVVRLNCGRLDWVPAPFHDKARKVEEVMRRLGAGERANSQRIARWPAPSN
jgi:hypothetical protein